MALQREQQEITEDNAQKEQRVDHVEIIFYTDPLCCWGWAFEPQWRRLQYEFNGLIECRYVMSGLIPTWENFNDPLYSVSRPMQMGPVWHETSLKSGMEIYDKIWVTDPPASSYPSCIAVKCADLQSPASGRRYLRLVREAVMLEGRNIAQKDVLISVATGLAKNFPGLLDIDKFLFDFTGSDNGIEAFRKDLNEVQSRNITRFPTLIIRSSNKPSVMLTGYRPYPVLLDAFKQVAPTTQPMQTAASKEAYITFWGNITKCEIAEVFPERGII